jgi:hypothetical protein
MPFIYRDPGAPSEQEEKLKGKDLGVTLDIGGKPQDMNLNPAEKMAKEFGGAVTEVVSRGAQFATKLPIVEPAFKMVADSPVGWAIGKGLDLLNVPSWAVQQAAARLRMLDQGGLPDDIRNMIASGRNADEVADYMVNSQRAFSNSKEANLAFQILLDPLNFTPLALGKISALKPLSAAAGLLGGTAVAGPIGGVVGAVAAYKAGRSAVRGAEKAFETAGKMDDLGTADKILLRLEKGIDKKTGMPADGYGMNLTERLRVGSQNEELIRTSRTKIDELISKGANPASSEVVALTKTIEDAESANNVVNAINNGFGIGMYRGMVGVSNRSKQGLRAVAGALVPASTNTIMRALGGYRANEIMDIHASTVAPELRPLVHEFMGRGASNFPVMAIGRLIARPESAKAKVIADSTVNTYMSSVKELNLGQVADKDIDNIAGQMIVTAREQGGTVAVLGISDNVDGVIKLKDRIRIISNVNDRANLANTGRASDVSTQALTEMVESEYVITALKQISRQEGGVERRVHDLLLDLGPDEMSRQVIAEIDRQVYKLVPRIINKQALKTEYLARTRSMSAAAGDTWTPVRQSASDEAFEKIFGKYFDDQGELVRRGGLVTKGATEADTRRMVARDFLLIDMAGFESANKWASQINEAIAPVTAKVMDPKVSDSLISKYGEEGFRQIRKAANNVGRIQVVRRKGMLFLSSARTMKSLYEAIQKIEGGGRDSFLPTAEARYAAGQPLVKEYIGSASDVAAIRSKIKNELMPDAKARGDSYSVDALNDVLEEMKKAENLLDVKKAWSRATLDMSEELGSTFSYAENPERIFRFVNDAIENGFAINPLGPEDMQDLARIVASQGMDPSILSVMNDTRYTIARAPKQNYHRVLKIIENPNIDGQTKALIMQSQVRPFIDMTSPYLKDVQYSTRYTASRLQHIIGSVFSPIGNSAVTSNIKNRMASYLARGGVSSAHVDRVMDEIVKEAIAQGVSARGLNRETMDLLFEKAFNLQEGFGGYDRFKDSWKASTASGGGEFKAVDAMMYSFQGDSRVVGYSQYASGAAKRWLPSIANITDRMYPQFRFKNNPLYWVQEFFESSTLNQARGVDREVISAITKDGQVLRATAGEIRDLANVAPQTHALIDNVNFLTVFRERALERALTGNWQVGEATGIIDAVKRKLSSAKAGAGRVFKAEAGDVLVERKDAAKDALAMDIASKQFAQELQKNDPSLYNSLVSLYGTSDSRTLFVRYADYRRRLFNQERVLSDIDAARPAGIGFNAIPDRTGQVYADVRYSIFGGKSSAGDEVAPSLVRREYLTRPKQAGDNLDVAYQRMSDSNYDMSMVDEEFAQLKAQLGLADDEIRRSGTVSALRTTKFNEAYDNLDQSLRKVQEIRNDADLRRLSAEIMIQDTAFAVGGEITYEGSRIAEALALGGGYGGDIATVSSTLQRIVRDAKAAVGSGNAQDLTAEIRRLSRQAISDDVKLLEALDSANYTLMTKHGVEEELFKAYRYVYEKALKQANRTTYFNPERSLFERSINHPFLGFYPYSYMFKKILPEMIEFLFKKPFGTYAPGAGYQSYIHVRDYVEHQIETDYTLRNNLENMDEVAFMVTQLFPGVPWDITAVPPAYLRNVARSLAGADKDYGIGDFVGRDILGSLVRFGPLATGENLAGAADQIVTQISGGNNPEPISQRATGEIDFEKYGGNR